MVNTNIPFNHRTKNIFSLLEMKLAKGSKQRCEFRNTWTKR
jgi:hypothetical protein